MMRVLVCARHRIGSLNPEANVFQICFLRIPLSQLLDFLKWFHNFHIFFLPIFWEISSVTSYNPPTDVLTLSIIFLISSNFYLFYAYYSLKNSTPFFFLNVGILICSWGYQLSLFLAFNFLLFPALFILTPIVFLLLAVLDSLACRGGASILNDPWLLVHNSDWDSNSLLEVLGKWMGLLM